MFVFACGQKKEIIEKDPLVFSIEQIKDLNTGLYPIRYELHFKNESDSGEDISYRWRFGDGGTADGYNANHAYVESGSYTVWLTKYKGGRAVDSGSNTIKVDAIPVIIRQSDYFYSPPIAIGTFGNKVYLAGIHAYNDNNNRFKQENYLIQYDSLWREQWTKIFPSELGEIKFMSVTANGDALVTIIKESEKSRLYRIDGSGNVKWTWTSPMDNMPIYASAEDKQGNIVMVVTKSATSGWRNVAIQLDASGNEKWTYDWPDNDLGWCNKVVTLNDGYVFAGYGGCAEGCIHVAKLGLDGKIAWNSVVPPGKRSAIGTDIGVYTVLDQANQLQVFTSSYYTYHTFDLNGKHLGSRELSVNMATHDVIVNKTGSVLVFGDQLLYGSANATLLELKSNNMTGWVYNSLTSIDDLNVAEYPLYTRGKSIALTDKNVALITGQFIWSNPRYPGIAESNYAAFVCQLDADGKLVK